MTGKKPRSEKRQRTVLRPARFTPAEAAQFDKKAEPYGGASAYIRFLALEKPLPRSKVELFAATRQGSPFLPLTR